MHGKLGKGPTLQFIVHIFFAGDGLNPFADYLSQWCKFSAYSPQENRRHIILW